MKGASVRLLESRYVTGRGGEAFFDGVGRALVYAASGGARLFLESGELSVPAGSLYLSSRGESFGIRAESGAIFLAFSTVSFSEDQGLEALFGVLHRPGERERRQLGEVLREISADRGDAVGERIIENSLMNLLLLLLRESEISLAEEKTALIEEVRTEAQAIRHYLLENYSSRITLEDLCFLFRTNRSALCRIFRREYGRTIQEYLQELRISEAKRLLREGDLSVTIISERVGFESVHYFSRSFKKRLGITPTEYGRAERKKKELMGDL